jgi:hypothetical protein
MRTIRPFLSILFVLGAALAVAPVASSAGGPSLVVRELSEQAHVKATVTFTTARCCRGVRGAQIAYLVTAKPRESAGASRSRSRGSPAGTVMKSPTATRPPTPAYFCRSVRTERRLMSPTTMMVDSRTRLAT